MKLIVMIPCLNEEGTLPQVLKSIPTQMAGISIVETLIVDDGSTDSTIDTARRCGVNHIVRLKSHMGLAAAFQVGVDVCLDLGADIIVNTDGDNQYPSESIPALVDPILKGEADITIGDRQTQTIGEFSRLKRFLQRFGTWMVRTLSGASDVRDAVSGFRAYSRYAASRIYLTTSFSYTIESVIQAGKQGLRIRSIPIRTNASTRPSRLYTSLPGFISRSITTMVRSYAMYEPLSVFLFLGFLGFLAGVAIGARFVYFMLLGQGQGHLQSLILMAVLLTLGLLLTVMGLLADLIATNRRLLEDLVSRDKARTYGLLESTHGIGTLDNGLSDLGEFDSPVEPDQQVAKRT